MRLVLDAGIGIGFWGLVLKTYIVENKARDIFVVGVGISLRKLVRIKGMGIYDDLVLCDVKFLPFRSNSFDTVIAGGLLDLEESHNFFEGVEFIMKKGGLLVTSGGLSNKSVNRLLKRDYNVYRVYLRGVMLKRANDGKKFYFHEKRARYIVYVLSLLPKMGKYLIAIKRKRVPSLSSSM